MHCNKAGRLNTAVCLGSETQVCFMQIGIECESCHSGIQTSRGCPLQDPRWLVRSSEGQGWRGQGLGKKILLLLVDSYKMPLPINERNPGIKFLLNYNLRNKRGENSCYYFLCCNNGG